MKKQNHILYCLIPILLVWGAAHFFSIEWGLPARNEFTPDCIYPKLSLNAEYRMKMDLCRYPPLQFLIVDSFSTPEDESQMSLETIRDLRSARILIYRTVCMTMCLGIMILIFSSGRLLGLGNAASAFAAILFQLTPDALFYSHTSNMDIPYTFWACAAFYTAAWTELRAKKKELFHLLTGVLIAFAFCTKDQAYALFVLPAFYLVYLRYKEKKDWKYAVLPLLLWLIGFLPAVSLIYGAVGGLKTAAAHFAFIVSDGRAGFAMVENNFSGRILLFLKHLLAFGPGFDWPLLLSGGTALILLTFRNRFRTFPREEKIFMILYGLVFLSVHFLFNQMTLTVYRRFMIPLIPFGTLLLVMLSARFRYWKWLLSATVLCQSAIGAQLLWNMMNCPQIRASADAVDLLKKGKTLCTMEASVSEFPEIKNGVIRKKRTVRSWSFACYEFSPYFIPDIPPEKFFTDMLTPDYLLSASGKKIDGYHIVRRYQSEQWIPTLFPYDSARIILQQRSTDIQPAEKADPFFLALPPMEQLIRTEWALRNMKTLTPDKMLFLKRSLKPCPEPDLKHYMLQPETLQVLQHFR